MWTKSLISGENKQQLLHWLLKQDFICIELLQTTYHLQFSMLFIHSYKINFSVFLIYIITMNLNIITLINIQKVDIFFENIYFHNLGLKTKNKNKQTNKQKIWQWSKV